MFIIEGEIPDYRNEAVIRTIRLLAPFVYDVSPGDHTQVTLRPACELESGSIYIGEWNESDMRHGKGI